MADNNQYDMQSLQQDAIRRAREMQARAQRLMQEPARPERSATHVEHGSVPPPRRGAEAPRPPARPPEQKPEKRPQPAEDIFESLMKDKERTLILLLIVLLMEEKADTGVILALMYLIL